MRVASVVFLFACVCALPVVRDNAVPLRDIAVFSDTDIQPPPGDNGNDVKWCAIYRVNVRDKSYNASKWSLSQRVGMNSMTSFVSRKSDSMLRIWTDDNNYRTFNPSLGTYVKDTAAEFPGWLFSGTPSDTLYAAYNGTVSEIDTLTGKKIKEVATLPLSHTSGMGSVGGMGGTNDVVHNRVFWRVNSEVYIEVWELDIDSGEAKLLYSHDNTRMICSLLYVPSTDKLLAVESYAPDAGKYALNNCNNNSATVESINLVEVDLSANNSTHQVMELTGYWSMTLMDVDNNLLYLQYDDMKVMDLSSYEIVADFPSLHIPRGPKMFI